MFRYSESWLTGMTIDGAIDTPTLKKENVGIAVVTGLTDGGVNDATNVGIVGRVHLGIECLVAW